MDEFTQKDHVIQGQHIRGYATALKPDASDSARLAVKQYTPKQKASGVPASRTITIIAAHANGFPKETYEPLWDDLLSSLRAQGCDIASIWFADCAHQGQSGILNEDILGDDPAWFDHSRDLLLMVNTFRAQMTRPIVGIAHSMGCAQLVQLAIIHPRLLTSLVLIEPVIRDGAPPGPNAAMMATLRPDLWPSRLDAENALGKNRMMRAWDPRALQQYLAHALRATPTALYPSTQSNPQSVTLTTSKYQEAWSYVRSNFEPRASETEERLLEPDAASERTRAMVFFRPECSIALASLPFVRPTVLWLFGAHSPLNNKDEAQHLANSTGTGPGGSGGVPAGRVAQKVLTKASHFIPCEQPKETAVEIASWLAEHSLRLFEQDEAFHRRAAGVKSANDMRKTSELWNKQVRQPASLLRPGFHSAKI